MKNIRTILFFLFIFALSFCLVIAPILMLLHTLKDVYLTKEEIFALVKENYSILLEDVHTLTFDKTSDIKGIEDIRNHNGVIQFNCGGKGNVASGCYYGFYYAEDDLPKVSFMGYLFYDESDLTPEGTGYSCSRVDYYYTEKISDYFYYFESHF